jgi:hypothetical protein
MPAKAGIQPFLATVKVDSGFRRNDKQESPANHGESSRARPRVNADWPPSHTSAARKPRLK